jgi:pyridoxal phosphate-dependent aminotransferase EpsN
MPRCVVLVNLYGQSADMDALLPICERYGVPVLEDAAESLGARYKGRASGSFGKISIYSFNGNKIITTSGGGALASDNPDWIARARYLSTQAREPVPHYEHVTYGYNYRLSNLCAAVGVGQLAVLEDRVSARRRIADRYAARLNSIAGFHVTHEDPAMRSNRWLTTIRIDPDRAGLDREDVRLALEAARIESRPLWKPMHMQPVFAEHRFIGGNVAETAFAMGLCLPSGSAMTDAEVDRVCDIIESRVMARAA